MITYLISVILFPLYLLLPSQEVGARVVYKMQNGKITFKSDAPLESILAESDDLRGIIDTVNNTFAFTVSVLSFHGFNGPLQKEHFNENYMESDKYPAATFIGKLIEEIDFSKDGIYEVRAKGVLNLHGIKQERIIKGKLEIENNKILLNSSFLISLVDHNIRIPRIVYQKIAPDINVELSGMLQLTSF